MSVVSFLGPENPVERGEIGRIDHHDLLLVHGHKPARNAAQADARALSQGDDTVGVIGIDDLRAAETHALTRFEHLTLDDLDAPHIPSVVQDLHGLDDRIRKTANSSLKPPLSGAEIQSGETMMPPDAFRMSWRNVTVLSTGPALRDP